MNEVETLYQVLSRHLQPHQVEDVMLAFQNTTFYHNFAPFTVFVDEVLTINARQHPNSHGLADRH